MSTSGFYASKVVASAIYTLYCVHIHIATYTLSVGSHFLKFQVLRCMKYVGRCLADTKMMPGGTVKPTNELNIQFKINTQIFFSSEYPVNNWVISYGDLGY